MTRESAVRIASLYPEILGTYGDSGNCLVLERRLAWRDLAVEVVTVSLGSPPPNGCDLYVLGGGEDDAQAAVLGALRASSALGAAVDRGVPVFAVCAGLQLLGHSFELARGEIRPGLGLLDVTTTRLRRRAVGEVVATVDASLGLPELTGFENHGGATRLGPDARPLARVSTGFGNGGGESRAEGALQASIVATYLHGPVLARNPALADLLLSRAVGTELAPLEIAAVDELRRERRV
jgi:CobQ-like glutamine amidotransferase family enzyme